MKQNMKLTSQFLQNRKGLVHQIVFNDIPETPGRCTGLTPRNYKANGQLG